MIAPTPLEGVVILADLVGEVVTAAQGLGRGALTLAQARAQVEQAFAAWNAAHQGLESQLAANDAAADAAAAGLPPA